MKKSTSMTKEEMEKQYDRFLEQLRKEVSELYWLYNFFFIIQSSLVYGIVSGNVNSYILFVKIAGLLMSGYWWWAVYKQKGWRDVWLEKLKDMEGELQYPSKFQMWTQDESSFISGRRGLWKLLMYLPIGFILLWLGLMLY